jgi:5-methyltetrahydrofolate--homocysteine methyltransferase
MPPSRLPLPAKGDDAGVSPRNPLPRALRPFWNGEVLVADGAMGTQIQALGLPPGGCPEIWNIERPDIIRAIHERYIDAGARLIETNTFGATRLKMDAYGLGDRVADYTGAAVEIALRAAEGRAAVAVSFGPIGHLVEPIGEISFEQAQELFAEEARAARSAGASLAIIETMLDVQEVRAAIFACRDAGLDIIAEMTFGQDGRAFTGTEPEAAVVILEALGAGVVGANCSLGPDGLRGVVERMAKVATVPVCVMANAGLPVLEDGETRFPLSAPGFADWAPKLVEAGASIVGSCCGSTPEYTRLIAGALRGVRLPETGQREPRLALASRRLPLLFEDAELPIVIGERINPTGRKKLSADIRSGAMAVVRQEARDQVAAGARMLDVNCGVPSIDEAAAMARAVTVVQDAVDVPLMIDSPGPDVLAAGMRAYSGKALVNSFSAEEGRAERVLPVAKRYGAAVLGLTIDDGGLPATARDRLRIAERLVRTAEEAGIPRQDVVIDCLCLTAGAQQDAARETLAGIRLVKAELGCATSLGISNISFGLPQRTFLNAVFLTMAIEAGLDMAIVNPLDLRLMDTVAATRVFRYRDRDSRGYIARMQGRSLVHTLEEAEAQLRRRGDPAAPPGTVSAVPGSGDAVSVPVADKAGQGAKAPTAAALARRQAQAGAVKQTGPDPERIPQEPLSRALYDAVVDGDKDGIEPLLEQALARGDGPVAILNDCLIVGMEEVGRLFGDGTYFLPQLMLSAEAMKRAFNRLKPELQKLKEGQAEVGTVVLATVQGDIHDIGKNICAVMLENHGFRVIDLGRNVKNELVVKTAQEAGADVVGLSALMTTTMPQMKRVIEMFRAEGVEMPVMIGGAATTRHFAREIGASGYGRDAQEAVAEAKRLVGAG